MKIYLRNLNIKFSSFSSTERIRHYLVSDMGGRGSRVETKNPYMKSDQQIVCFALQAGINVLLILFPFLSSRLVS